MNTDQFKARLTNTNITMHSIAKKVDVDLKALISVCDSGSVPFDYQWALYTLEFEQSKQRNN